jgi:hypothetical protein
VHITHQAVLTITKSASEIAHAENSVDKLREHDKDADFEKDSACFQVRTLHGFQTLDKLSLFFHEASFFFAAMLL